MQIEFQTTVDIDDAEREVIVTAEYTPGHPGSFYRHNGDPGDPPESAECEIAGVIDVDGRDLITLLHDRDVDRLIEEAISNADQTHLAAGLDE
jgi:hypothetical protein